MGRARAPRWLATILAVGIGLVALFALTTSGAAAPAAHDCAAAAVGCESPTMPMQTASQAPTDPVTTTVPCLHSAGCGGGGVLTLIGVSLALLLVAVPLALPPRSRPRLMRPSGTAPLPQLLLVCDDGRPPRLAAA